MELSLKQRIEKYLKNRPGEWVNGGFIEQMAMSVGKKASNASRRCRELCEEGKLERQIRKGNGVASVWYRFKVSEVRFTRQLTLTE